MDHRIINRNRSDHNRAFMGQFLTEWLGVAMAGQIHDGFRSQVHGAHYLLHLHVIILAVPGNTQVHIDLGAEHTAHALRV